ncbi:hypothetical protein BT96DRAFT_923254 [Gymnopus androsaceus JB14]|uniref:Glycopeptide n=1 Tax=Gymnopus androsaceus JB14 TaxID=1447944 RepID=A0A6A4HC54_9AGAR|nr:hypothetical protein BT96DRAFT_923254 [Gymnopus androsaceus JB14]
MQFTASFSILASLVAFVAAESHTISFTNNCGGGTPTLVQDGAILSTGGAYTADGPIIGAIAYLQTGGCGLNGDFCTTVETTLQNPTSPGAGSSHRHHSHSRPRVFCQCWLCLLQRLRRHWSRTAQVVTCEADNVDLAITFCV